MDTPAAWLGLAAAIIAVLVLRSRSDITIGYPQEGGASSTEPPGKDDEEAAGEDKIEEVDDSIEGVPYKIFLDRDDGDLTVEMGLTKELPDGFVLDLVEKPSKISDYPYAGELSALLKLGADYVIIGNYLKDSMTASIPTPSGTLDRAMARKLAVHLKRIRDIVARM